MNKHKLIVSLLETVVLCGISMVFTVASEPVCCFPKQFESFMFAVNAGAGDTISRSGVSFSLANGTIRTAYDAINQRTYFFTNYTQFSSDEPGTLNVYIRTIQDYKKKVRYYIFKDIICQEGPIEDDLFIECIPGDAEVVGEGTLGDSSAQVVSYLVYETIQGIAYQMIVSVIHTDKPSGECVPVRISVAYNPPDKGAVVKIFDVIDVTRGIKDTSIFIPPPNCRPPTT